MHAVNLHTQLPDTDTQIESVSSVQHISIPNNDTTLTHVVSFNYSIFSNFLLVLVPCLVFVYSSTAIETRQHRQLNPPTYPEQKIQEHHR